MRKNLAVFALAFGLFAVATILIQVGERLNQYAGLFLILSGFLAVVQNVAMADALRSILSYFRVEGWSNTRSRTFVIWGIGVVTLGVMLLCY